MDGKGQSVDFPYLRPEEIGRWEAVKLAIWDSDKGQFFGRTAKSWGGILIFYAIFYTVLAALFAVCMQGLLYTTNDREPTWKLSESLIGDNPGMGFRPMAEDVEQAGSLIWYKASNETDVEYWTKILNDYLEPYYNQSAGGNAAQCHYGQEPLAGDKVCTVNTNDWGPCSRENGYSFNKSSPCIFIKLNKIIGWAPEFYGRDDLPEDMPLELKNHIQNVTEDELKTVWVSCHGENPADIENIGPMVYHGPRGFPGYYFPYTNAQGYLSPLAVLQFGRPTKNVLINIECRAWAKNIRYAKVKSDREGSVHLELMVD